jgi:putative ABC transport system permease protein
VAALRQPTLVTMALRNISRRRAEAALVVAGALLGTAVITSAFVVGDVVEGSFADAARTQYGPLDITLTPTEGADLAAVTAAVESAAVDGIDGLLPATTVSATLEAPQQDAAVPRVVVVELDVAAASAFGSDPQITGLADSAAPASDEILVNERTASLLGVEAGETIRVHAYGSHLDLAVNEVVAEVGLAGYGGAIVAPGTITRLADAATLVAAGPQQHLLVSLDGGVFDTRALSDAAVSSLRTAVAGLNGVEVEAP